MIHFHPEVKNNALDVDNPVHENILIEGNTFYLEQSQTGKIVEAESVKNLTIQNNTIKKKNPEITLSDEVQNKILSVGENTIIKGKAKETNMSNNIADSCFSLINSGIYDIC